MNKEFEICIDPEDAEELAAGCSTEDYMFLDIDFLGEWRHGNEYQVTFKDIEDNYWSFKYKESIGDEYWSSIQSSEANFVVCFRVEPIEVTTIKYVKVIHD